MKVFRRPKHTRCHTSAVLIEIRKEDHLVFCLRKKLLTAIDDRVTWECRTICDVCQSVVFQNMDQKTFKLKCCTLNQAIFKDFGDRHVPSIKNALNAIVFSCIANAIYLSVLPEMAVQPISNAFADVENASVTRVNEEIDVVSPDATIKKLH